MLMNAWVAQIVNGITSRFKVFSILLNLVIRIIHIHKIALHFIKAIDGNDTEPSSTFGTQPTTEISQTTTMTTFFTDDQNLYTYYKNPQGAKLLFYSIKIVVLI